MIIRENKKRLAPWALMSLLLTTSTAFPQFAAANDKVINLSDPLATRYTKELFSFFQQTSGKKILFGQQHVTDEGLTLLGKGNRVGSVESDVKNAIGDYPALFGWDMLSIDGKEKPGNAVENQEQRITNLATSMKTAHDLGAILTLSMHPDNFVTGNHYGDVSGNVVQQILPGGTKNKEFNTWLDNIASLANKLVDKKGEYIPLIFRPFHEQTGSWFWWGAGTTTPEQYKAIYRYTVDYLRDTKHIHNILYGFSPGSGAAGDLKRYLETYPGDDYVDIFGIDSYDNKSDAGSDAWLKSLVTDLSMISTLAEEKGKISALTEFGYSPQGLNKSGNTADWYTRVLNAISSNADSKKVSYMLTWANFGWPNNMFVPYRDVNGNLGGDHHLLADFKKFYNDKNSSFRNEINGKIYNKKQSYSVAEHAPFMYLLSPTTGSYITDNSIRLNTKVVNDPNARVTFSLNGANETDMKLNRSGIYSAEYIPAASLNGKSVEMTVNYRSNGKLNSSEKLKLHIQVPEISIKKISVNQVESNGTWPEGANVSLSTEIISAQEFLKVAVKRMPASESWQELKFELKELGGDLANITRIKFDAYIPDTAGSGEIQSVAILPPDWNTKFSSERYSVNDLETISIKGKNYKKLPVSLDITGSENAESLAFSLVGVKLNMTDAFYINHIELLNAYVTGPADPLLVDDFEKYLGDDALLHRKYSSAGDPITLKLSVNNKNAGDFGAEYNYTIGDIGYAGRQTLLGSVDWSATNALQFWLKHNGPGQHLTVQIQMGGVSFEYNIALDKPFEGIVTIPFVDFLPAHWEGDQSARVTRERLNKISQFALYTGGNKGKGTLYFDDLRAIHADDTANVPTAK